ncbi:hypothetical protein [Ruficoccus sp. ZRK36]|uniref:hypothetical protein n=1 Tax=Ruficoccus sp. ZRK36 TaxID=2866311 RepID=UPI001C7395F4|nr:hypothetical protein [Ruficoccus sp. ZRK36]QYY35301.1 hypothetical protein K0V07_13495 [Ruficoccus sp. ZRK36]
MPTYTGIYGGSRWVAAVTTTQDHVYARRFTDYREAAAFMAEHSLSGHIQPVSNSGYFLE